MSDNQFNEAEMIIAINPTNPDNMVIACHEGFDPDGIASLPYPESIDTFYTLDGGTTWHNVKVNSSVDGYNFDSTVEEDCRADPTIAFDEDGVLYVGYIIIPDYNKTSGIRRLVVGKSTNSGMNYNNFNIIDNGQNIDKCHLASGPDPQNNSQQNAYITWDESGVAQVAYSTDSGNNWSSPKYSDNTSGDDRLCDPAVGPEGNLYVSWVNRDNDSIYVAMSDDKGDSFYNPVHVTDVYTDFCFMETIPAAPTRGVGVGPVLDVDRSGGPHDGRIYLAYGDADSNIDDVDVYVTYSDDEGDTWETPIRVNDDSTSTSQFLPWIDVDQKTGMVIVIWYDARDDPVNNEKVYVYGSYSFSVADGFSSNVRISDEQSDQSGGWERDYLEYIGVVSYDNKIQAIWADNSQDENNNDIYTSSWHVNEASKYTVGKFVLTDPRKVVFSYYHSVVNNGTDPVVVETRFAVPPSSSKLHNQSIVGTNYFPDTMDFEQDEWGQSVAINERTVAPGEESTAWYETEAIVYNITYNIDPDMVQGEIPQDIYDAYTADAEKYMIEDPILLDAVEDAVGSETNLYLKAKLLHDYVKDNIYYCFGGGWEAAPAVLQNGCGSCSEYVFLYIALCRIAGIPARYVSSTLFGSSSGPGHTFPYEDDMYHRWTQIYLPGYGWVPVDVTWDDSTSSDLYFGRTSNWVVATNIGGGPSSHLEWNHHSADSWQGDVELLEKVAIWDAWEETTPRDIKRDAAIELESIDTGNVFLNGWIEFSADEITLSLDDEYWVDDSHLDPHDGRNVFQTAAAAVMTLEILSELTGVSFHSVLEKLVNADKLLAEISIEEAGSMPVSCWWYSWIVEELISSANEQLYEAERDRGQLDYESSVMQYMTAWQLAQWAIEKAEMTCWP
ncbi:MAG: hypothetical protein GY854_06185 [Deltaproteobacteria bacterium]|nr:hypothetical protein [Deltaproteobacteria bacterium]